MGSRSDLEVVRSAAIVLKQFGITADMRIMSAHRTPDEAADFAKSALESGYGVIIAAAGKSAHLAGVIAALTPLPVIALPIKTSLMGGLDSLLSMVQMPNGIPVATVGIDAGENAGVLAAQILAVSNAALLEKIIEYKAKLADKVRQDDQNLQSEI